MVISAKLLNEGEHVVVSTRTHAKVLVGPVLLLLVTVFLAGFLSTLGEGGAAALGHLAVWVLAAVVVARYVVRPFLRWLTTTYTFTNRRFIKRSGLVSRQGRTIPLNRISGVDFEVDVLDRLFGCGTLVVSDASEHGRVLISDIPHVERVQMLVADELHRLTYLESRADDGL